MDSSIKPVTLHVPNRLSALAAECQSVYRDPVEIRPYRKLSQQLYKRMAKNQAILVAGDQEIGELLKDWQPNPNGAPLVGKILVLAADSSSTVATFNGQRGVDYVNSDPTPADWSFKINRTLADLEYDANTHALREELAKKENDLDHLNEIGMALSTEKDLDQLLELIVLKSRDMASADAGSLYLIEADPNIQDDPNDYFKNKKMRFQVAQNDSRDVPFKSFLVEIAQSSVYGYVALNQENLNFEDVYFLGDDHAYGWGGRNSTPAPITAPNPCLQCP